MTQRNTGGRTRAALFLALSATAAIVAVVMIYVVVTRLQQQLADAEKPAETTKVVVAKTSLYQGHTIAEEDVEFREVLPDFVPETALRSLDEVVGRVPAERILQGDYLRAERLADRLAGVGLNAIVPNGMRAVSINITDGSAVSGFLNPGNYVDVLVTIRGDRGDKTLQTVTLLQAKKVLAVNSRLGLNDEDGPSRDGITYQPSVTIGVTPLEAEMLAHAHTQGSVTLTLRNDVDVTQVATNGARADKLLGRADQKVIEFKDVKPTTVAAERRLQVIRGQSVEIQKVK